MLLELIRRSQREYDRYIVKQIQQAGSRSRNSNVSNAQVPLVNSTTADGKRVSGSTEGPDVGNAVEDGGKQFGRQTILQQVVRAWIYVVQFALA